MKSSVTPTPLLLAVGLLLTLTACQTPYQSRSLTGGHSETRLAKNQWIVVFEGNGYTSPQRAADLSLLRAAELVQENGYGYFLVIDSNQNTQQAAFTTPTTSTTTFSGNTFGGTTFGTATTTTYGGQTYLISKPSASNHILALKTPPEDKNVPFFRADFVERSLRAKYNLTDAFIGGDEDS